MNFNFFSAEFSQVHLNSGTTIFKKRICTGLKGKKKKKSHIWMRDEYWMIILVNSLSFCHYYGMGGD
jgi:hypothetical protein